VNILDEQIVENQRQLLKSWRITRRLLRHSEFDTVAKRMGKVIRVSSMGLTV